MKFSVQLLRNGFGSLASAALVVALPLNVTARTPGLGVLQTAPLCFEPCRTSEEGAAGFQSRGLNYQIGLFPTEAQIVLSKVKRQLPDHGLARRQAMSTADLVSVRALRIGYRDADSTAVIKGLHPTVAAVNYLTGSRRDWRTGVGTFEKVRVEGLYPGIDLVYYGNQGRLEYDFHVAPGSDPAVISMQFHGADQLSLDKHGNLVITLGDEKIVQQRPVLFQSKGGSRQMIPGSFDIRQDGTVGFLTGAYDSSLPLVIDPILSYASYFGGSAGDLALAVKLDANGFVYVAGQTLSPQFSFPIPAGALQPSFAGGKINGDAFIAKFNPTGSALVYFTYLGGSGNDGALDLAVTPDGHAYVSGFTDSADFPTTAQAFDRSISGPPAPTGVFYTDAFVAKIDPSGSALLYSTYLGGGGADAADSIAVDAAGSAYVTGYTYSRNFPLANPLPGHDQLRGVQDAFVAKLSPNGSTLQYSTFLGGDFVDEGQGIAVDASGFAVVTGYTGSTNFPTTTDAYRRVLNGSPKLPLLYDAFVTKIAPPGNAFAYSTLLGGTNNDAGFRVRVDGEGSAYVTGGTRSVDFPNTTTSTIPLRVGFTNTNPRTLNYDAFISKFTSNGALAWSTRFGGNRDDVGWDLDLDANNRVFVAGITSNTNFPALNNDGIPAILKANRRSTNYVFITALNADGSGALYSLFFGGSRNDMGYGVASDPAGNAYVAGRTLSADFPTASPLQESLDGQNDAFLAKVSLEPTLVSAAEGGMLELSWRAFSSEYGVESSIESKGENGWTELPVSPILSNGWHKVRLGPTNEGGFFRLRRSGSQ